MQLQDGLINFEIDYLSQRIRANLRIFVFISSNLITDKVDIDINTFLRSLDKIKFHIEIIFNRQNGRTIEKVFKKFPFNSDLTEVLEYIHNRCIEY